MADPRGHVRPGQKLTIAATQINWINEQMRRQDGVTAPPIAGFMAPYAWVYCKNETGDVVDRWGVMQITGLEVTPTATDTDRATAQFCEMPIVIGESITSSDSKWCVAIEPIKAGKIGRVAVDGVVQVKKADLTKLAGVTVLWEDSNWALVRAGGGDPVRLGKTTSDWLVNTKATLDVWESGTSPGETKTTGEQLDAVNKTKTKVSAGVFVIVAKGKTGEWYLVEEGQDLCANGSWKALTLSPSASNESGSGDILEGTGMQILGNDAGCVKWLKLAEITYISNVTLGENGLSFDIKKAWVFESANEAGSVTIEATDCT